jgi:hypothetical protein
MKELIKEQSPTIQGMKYNRDSEGPFKKRKDKIM